LQRRKNIFDDKLNRPTKKEGEVLIIFCINCGEIIGPSGDLYYRA